MIKIGLLPEIDPAKIIFVGNGSLMGAKMSSLTNRIRKDVVEFNKRAASPDGRNTKWSKSAQVKQIGSLLLIRLIISPDIISSWHSTHEESRCVMNTLMSATLHSLGIFYGNGHTHHQHSSLNFGLLLGYFIDLVYKISACLIT